MIKKGKSKHTTAVVHVGGGAPKRSKGVVLSLNRIVALAFLVVFGAIGSYFIFASHADSYTTLYELSYPGGSANDIYRTTSLASEQEEVAHGWKLLGSYRFVNEPGSAPVPIYRGHKTGTRENAYVTSPANIPFGYINEGVAFSVSSSAKVPYGYCRTTTSGYKLDMPCATNPAPVTPTVPKPAAPSTPTPTAPKPIATNPRTTTPIKGNHNPYGDADYCAYVNGSTVIYGWANDPDAPQGAAPNVAITVRKLAHGPSIKGVNPATVVATATVPTDGAHYRDDAINAGLKTRHNGDPATGTYGFRAAYSGLTKNFYYEISGTVVNAGALGSNATLRINDDHHVDGDASKPYFAGSVIPQTCLAPPPKTGTPVIPPAPVTPPVAKPVASPKPIAHGIVAVNGKVDCTDKNYVAAGNKCEKIRYKDIAHGKTATNADRTICDDGYKLDAKGKKDKCELDNSVVLAYSGFNDGCGGNATHYAHNKKTHVAQKNFGTDSWCKCASSGKFVAYTKPMSDSKNNSKCTSGTNSSSNSTSGSGSGSSHGSGSGGSNSCNGTITAGGGCKPSNSAGNGSRNLCTSGIANGVCKLTSSSRSTQKCSGRIVAGECMPKPQSGHASNSHHRAKCNGRLVHGECLPPVTATGSSAGTSTNKCPGAVINGACKQSL